mgnify:CR=1 FL=1
MKRISKARWDRNTVVVTTLGAVLLCVVSIAIFVFLGKISKSTAQLIVNTGVSAASIVIAFVTVIIYKRQNSIIEEQTKATIQGRKASIQTLDMAAVNSNRDIVVELSNSGGGAARNLRGVVEIEIPDSYGIDSDPHIVTGRRKSSVGKRSENRTWRASKGNKIAAGEEQVPVEVQCTVNLPGYDRQLGFPAALRELSKCWHDEQLSRLSSALSAEELEEIGEQWDEQIFLDLADPSQSIDTKTIEAEDLIAIATTVAESNKPFSDSGILEREVRLKVRIEYIDEYIEMINSRGEPQSIDLDETREAPVLDATIPVIDQASLQEIFEEDYRTERQEIDPERSALRT